MRPTVRCPRLALVVAGLAALAACGPRLRPSPVPPAPAPPSWPALTSEARPWAIWWWPGSAVEEPELEAHLRRYAQAGLGGVHVVPIYGVRGAEDRFLPFLGKTWLDRLRFTVRTAGTLGLGVDLSTGTGWPFGGPQVDEPDGSRAAIVERFLPGADGRLAEPVRARGRAAARLVALMAHARGGGEAVDVTSKVDAASGRLDWVAPADGWDLFALFEAPTGMKVKRAAPGGEGRVIDHLSEGALARYLARFDGAFGGRPLGVRGFCNDSFEDMGSDFTGDFLAAFATRRGYDLRQHLPALSGLGDARVLADYRETVSDLLLERFTRPWVAWTHRQGARAHDQAHGAPANLLDLYAAADIPQTESFGPTRLPIPGLRAAAGLPAHFGKPDLLFAKFASSAAHLAGRPLVSAETATWLDEHFQVAPSQVKPGLDQLFLAGINHVFFHGVTYSPATAPWPGWLFYASTDFGPHSGFWQTMPALSAYVARTQAMLQAGTPDRDLLVYFPVHDSWQLTPQGSGKRLLHFTAHDVDRWLHQHPTGLGRVAKDLLAAGVMFDFVSDRLLAAAPEASTILVPGARLVPVDTWDQLHKLAEAGATVLFVERLPDDVPGLGAVARRREQLRERITRLGPGVMTAGVRHWPVGRGRFLLAPDLTSALAAAAIRREALASAGVGVLRERMPDGHLYFLANLGAREFQGWAPLAVPAAAALVMDALTGRQGLAELRAGGGGPEIFLRLSPGTSLLLRTFDQRGPAGPRWRWLLPTDEIIPLTTWQLSFVSGGPRVPPPTRADGPQPWTALGGPVLQSFSGTGVYRTELQRPARDGAWILELGEVQATAAVRVNGFEAGPLWALPFQIDVTPYLRPGRNTLEVEVTNLPANRIAAEARAGAPPLRYHGTNFVDMQYRPFDPAGWSPSPSGLVGPVRLRRYQAN